MEVTVTPQQRQAAEREIVRQVEQGAKASLARVQSTVPMHRTTVYRLLKRVQYEVVAHCRLTDKFAKRGLYGYAGSENVAAAFPTVVNGKKGRLNHILVHTHPR